MSRAAQHLEFPSNFTDDSPFLQQALSEYLKANYRPLLMFYELSADAREEVLARAQELKDRRKA
jgi:hypothetical protein